MNIIAIIGSPRKNGNTHTLVNHVLQGAQESGASTDTVMLGDLTIRECDGCHACWKGKECPKHDDMNDLYPRLMAADAFVFGTPVYWYGPTALMKGFVDRLVYFNCPEKRAAVRSKPAAIVVPFEEDCLDMARPIEEFFRKSLGYLEMVYTGSVLVPGVTKLGEVKERAADLERARALGRELTARIELA